MTRLNASRVKEVGLGSFVNFYLLLPPKASVTEKSWERFFFTSIKSFQFNQ